MFRFSVQVIFMLVSLVAAKNFSVLLIGDSIDRFMVQDWCARKEMMNHLSVKPDSQVEMDRITISPGFELHYCIGSIDSYTKTIAAIHIFGSSSNGPYYKMDYMNSIVGHVTSSEVRIRSGINKYIIILTIIL